MEQELDNQMQKNTVKTQVAKDKQENSAESQRNPVNMSVNTRMKLIIAATILLMIVLAFGMFFYVQRSIHKERVVHLKTQTTTTRNLINKTIEEYSSYASTCSSIISSNLNEGDNVYEFLDEVQDMIYMENVNLILVDENCNWYSNVNHNGRINEINMYTDDTADQEIYMTQEVFSNKDCIVVRNRLDEPIVAETNTGAVTIKYCAALCYMDDLEKSISVAFPYDGNKFILDSKGGMLYKNFNMGVLVGGTNVFSKYDRVKFLYGDRGDELLQGIKNGRTSVAEFKGDGGSYFICTSRLRYCNWYLSYVLSADELASGSYIKIVVAFILGMSLIFTLAIIVILLTQVRVRTTNRQIEQERRENEILGQVARQKSEFLSNMSHDIRTPINGIMGMTALARKAENRDKTYEYLDKINRASQHLLSLVNDVLDMSSIENGKVTINKKSTDMRRLPADCVDMLNEQAENNGLKIISEFAELSHPIVLADELKIRQIILNILSNSIKYTDAGGQVIFRVSEETKATVGDADRSGIANYRFEIEDNGIGMSDEFLERIWDSFAQENAGSRTSYKGTGLGMTITKTFVDLMNGSIDVESELGKGSRFTVILPLEISKEEVSDIEGNAVADNIEGIRILLVEDNELNIEIAQELLEDEGAEVTLARNGREAVDAFAGTDEGRFDVILMDVMMPEMNGYEATRAIRAMARADAAGIPIIAMTANAYEDDIRASHAAGMNAHLSKPLNIELMIRTIAELCSNR